VLEIRPDRAQQSVVHGRLRPEAFTGLMDANKGIEAQPFGFFQTDELFTRRNLHIQRKKVFFREPIISVEHDTLDRVHLKVDDVSDSEFFDLGKIPFGGITEHSYPLREQQVRVITKSTSCN